MQLKTTLQIIMAFLALPFTPVQAQDLPRELTLSRTIEIALQRHGDIEAAQAAINARAGAQRQAGYSPNPIFYFQSENWRFTGTPGFSPGRDLDVFAFVSQPIETAGKKRYRVQLAAEDRKIAEIQEKAVTWKIRQEVKAAYWRVLAAQRDAALLGQSQKTFDQLEGYHEVRVRLGAMAEVDLIKVRLEAERVDMAVASAEMEIERAKIGLLRAMGVQEVSTQFVVREEPPADVSINWEAESLQSDLVEAALAHRHEILLGEARIALARAGLSVQQAAARPDITPYVGYKRSGPFNTLVGGVSLPLPLFNRNAGGIDEAVAEVHRREASLRAAQARVRAEVAAALSAIQRRAKMLQSIETGMLERARQTSRIALAAYQEGGTDLLNVLDAQRSENQVGLFYSQVLFDYNSSLIDLETAAGTEALPGAADWKRAASSSRLVK